ncbi:MAG: hypothetical protein R6X21_08820 [Candidatus Aminicenantes bacterium]
MKKAGQLMPEVLFFAGERVPSPAVKLGFIGEDSGLRPALEPMNRQFPSALPELAGTYASSQILGDLLPGFEQALFYHVLHPLRDKTP